LQQPERRISNHTTWNIHDFYEPQPAPVINRIFVNPSGKVEPIVQKQAQPSLQYVVKLNSKITTNFKRNTLPRFFFYIYFFAIMPTSTRKDRKKEPGIPVISYKPLPCLHDA